MVQSIQHLPRRRTRARFSQERAGGPAPLPWTTAPLEPGGAWRLGGSGARTRSRPRSPERCTLVRSRKSERAGRRAELQPFGPFDRRCLRPGRHGVRPRWRRHAGPVDRQHHGRARPGALRGRVALRRRARVHGAAPTGEIAVAPAPPAWRRTAKRGAGQSPDPASGPVGGRYPRAPGRRTVSEATHLAAGGYGAVGLDDPVGRVHAARVRGAVEVLDLRSRDLW